MCNGSCVDGCPIAEIDRQSGTTKSTAAIRRNSAKPISVAKGAESYRESVGYEDSGGASRFFYHAKASRRDRNEGCEGMPLGNLAGSNKWTDMGQTNGSGKLANGDGTITPQANSHPTVKPTDLMRWLIRLVAKPGETILDPFMGSGSTLKAAALEGVNAIGIEMSPEYLKIAEARVRHAENSGREAMPLFT